MTLNVYSGKVRLCEVGQRAEFRDMNGKQLFTGDIVVICTQREDGCVGGIENLSVVVRDQFHPIETGSAQDIFVMGIRSIDLVDEPGYWRVFKVKDYSDVIAGEHWTAWGFSYQESEVSA